MKNDDWFDRVTDMAMNNLFPTFVLVNLFFATIYLGLTLIVWLRN